MEMSQYMVPLYRAQGMFLDLLTIPRPWDRGPLHGIKDPVPFLRQPHSVPLSFDVCGMCHRVAHYCQVISATLTVLCSCCLFGCHNVACTLGAVDPLQIIP